MFELPIVTKNDNDYLNSLKKNVYAFIDEYKKLKEDINYSNSFDDIDEICKNIKKNYKLIEDCFKFSFMGQYYKSILKMKKMIIEYEEVLCHNIDRSYAFGKGLALISKNDDPLILYKGRKCDYPYQKYEMNEMHQIPMDARWKITAQRFSMPGVPCLYLASNSYIVWHELGQPELDKLEISAFKIDKSKPFKIIDLTFIYQEIYNLAKLKLVNKVTKSNQILNLNPLVPFFNTKERAKKIASIWPLLAAVSIQCTQLNRSFKSEYVIPQLLMHCVDDKIKGIAYRCNAIKSNTDYPSSNLAIPILNYNEGEKFGDIKDYITLTDPMNIQYFKDNIYRTQAYPSILEDGGIKYNNTLYVSSFNKMIKFNIFSYDGMISYKDTFYHDFDNYILYYNDNKFKKIEE